MLYDLPFTKEFQYIDEDEYEDFKDKFLSILDELEDEFGWTYWDIRTPAEGSVVRTYWQYIVKGKAVVINKKTGQVSLAD